MKDAPKKNRRGVGRVMFLARLEDFRKLIDAGWPITAIYEDHGGSKTGMSYSQFARYIGKYVRPPTPRRNDSEEISPLTTSVLQPQSTTAIEPTVQTEGRSKKPEPFQHNPNGGNDRDDLI